MFQWSPDKSGIIHGVNDFNIMQITAYPNGRAGQTTCGLK